MEKNALGRLLIWISRPEAIAILVGVGAILALVVLHLVARIGLVQASQRLEIRTAERERVARELHDTLLQDVQGLIYRFQATTDEVPPDSSARQALEEILLRAEAVLEESRRRMTDLQLPTLTLADLEFQLSRAARELSEHHPSRFTLSSEGDAFELRPSALEAIALIARMALFDAYTHAQAANIHVHIRFAPTEFCICVHDDGPLPAKDLERDALGSRRHALAAMRARANAAGGNLSVTSRDPDGTDVVLRIPASLAYLGIDTPAGTGALSRLLSVLRRRERS